MCQIPFMKVFDGKKAAQDYMSKHTLAFSTPELTLMRFAFWLGDTVPDPQNKDNSLPRMLTFMVEQDFAPILIDDDKYGRYVCPLCCWFRADLRK